MPNFIRVALHLYELCLPQYEVKKNMSLETPYASNFTFLVKTKLFRNSCKTSLKSNKIYNIYRFFTRANMLRPTSKIKQLLKWAAVRTRSNYNTATQHVATTHDTPRGDTADPHSGRVQLTVVIQHGERDICFFFVMWCLLINILMILNNKVYLSISRSDGSAVEHWFQNQKLRVRSSKRSDDAILFSCLTAWSVVGFSNFDFFTTSWIRWSSG